MGYITVGQENSTPIELYYEDHGTGQAVVLVHGYPLDGSSWEKQASELRAAGYRVVTYDRRGFGKSSKVEVGYDYETFASDLNALLTTLELTNVILVGFSMGTGEPARYATLFGTERIAKFVFLAALEPGMLDNGVPKSLFDGIVETARTDRFAWYSEFYNNFYNLEVNLGSRVSQAVVDANWATAVSSAPVAAYAVVPSWIEDFSPDVAALEASGKPVLIVHGTEDRILPIDATGRPFHATLPAAEYHEIDGAPHGMLWTHAAEVNAILLAFVRTRPLSAAGRYTGATTPAGGRRSARSGRGIPRSGCRSVRCGAWR